MSAAAEATCHPVALDRDILPESLVRARYLGMGIVLWRADDGAIRVWEDRCPHRSVRLSAGRNLGDCVEGIYHGWRFGKDGAVIAIPAEGNAPRPDIRVNAVASAVQGGMVWVSSGKRAAPPADFKPARSEVLIRPLPFRAAAEPVARAVKEIAGMRLIATPTGEAQCMVFGYAKHRVREGALDAARRCNHRLNALRRVIEAGGTA